MSVAEAQRPEYYPTVPYHTQQVCSAISAVGRRPRPIARRNGPLQIASAICSAVLWVQRKSSRATSGDTSARTHIEALRSSSIDSQPCDHPRILETANRASLARKCSAQVDELLAAITLSPEEADALTDERRGLELQLSELAEGGGFASSLVEDRVRLAQSAQLAYANGDAPTRRKVVAQLLWNLTLKDGRIASYQYKRPFAVLEKDPSGAFLNTWWAM